MPTYEYKCNACNHAFELFHSMKDSPKRKCPACGKNALERLIGTGAAIIFKGSGFYETDYRTESYKKSAEAEKGAASPDSKAEAKSEANSDSKPDSRADRKPEAKPDPKPQAASKTKGEPGAKKETGPAKGSKPRTPASKQP